MITNETRHPTASMVILDGRYVLLIEHKASGKWQFPGGHVDENEAGHEAAQREVFEETGIKAEVISNGRQYGWSAGAKWHPTPFQVMEFPAPAKPDRPGKPAEPEHWHIDSLYLGRADRWANLVALESEVKGARWVLLEDLHSIPVRDEVEDVAHAAWEELNPLPY